MKKACLIRPLKTASEKKRFSRIARYCFNDQVNWTDRIFPLRHGDRAWGAFQGKLMESGLVTRNYQARVFGSLQPVSGISLVETPPEYRNRSNISALFAGILPQELESGKILSILYPFSFRYYAKYGYGQIGGPLYAQFTPESIRLERPDSGEFRAFDGTARDVQTYFHLCQTWTERFSLGIRPRPLPVREFIKGLEWAGDHIVFFQRGSTCTGVVCVHKDIKDRFVSELDIRKIAWRDEEAFLALLYLLRTHRGQISKIRWYMPANVPLALIMDEPRIELAKVHDWMARPLDLLTLIKLKAGRTPVQGEIAFSVQDDILPRNTGTYRIRGNDVSRKPFDPKKALPLPLLSSLICGGVSLGEARLAGLLPLDMPAEAENFFTRDPDIFLNEFF